MIGAHLEGAASCSYANPAHARLGSIPSSLIVLREPPILGYPSYPTDFVFGNLRIPQNMKMTRLMCGYSNRLLVRVMKSRKRLCIPSVKCFERSRMTDLKSFCVFFSAILLRIDNDRETFHTFSWPCVRWSRCIFKCSMSTYWNRDQLAYSQYQ